MTTRETVAIAMQREIKPALIKSHKRNYETLYVYPDGRLHWAEAISSDERLVDDDSHASGESIKARVHLVQVGTGSVDCNCDNCCGPDHFDSPSDIEFESDDFEAMGDCLDDGLAEIAHGYFDDES